MGVPDPFRLRYRAELQEGVRQVLRSSRSFPELQQGIANYIETVVLTEDRIRFLAVLSQELRNLSEGMGLPRWQVYLGAKDTQPGIRFLQFIHKAHNPTGSATLVYPTRLRNDHDRGVPLIVPLGEGLDTPPRELTIAHDLQNLVLFRPV